MRRVPGPVRHCLLFFALAFALDFLIMRVLYWRLPDETAWDTAALYHFETTARRLARAKPPGERRVLIVGSSIAHYAVLPERLTGGSGAGRLAGARAELFAFQGMHPAHLLAATRRILAARPDLVVLPMGFVDLRMERPLVLGQMDALERGGSARAAALAALGADLLEDERFRIIDPVNFLGEFGRTLDPEQFAAGVCASLSATYRYRAILSEPLEVFFARRFSRGRHYHQYAGIPVGGGGVHHRGWTGTEFELVLTEVLLGEGLWLEAPEPLFEQARRTKVEPRLRLRFVRAGAEVVADVILRPGWQNVASPPGARVGDRVSFKVEPGWWSEELADTLGVRLSAAAGRDEFARRGREVRREDLLYAGYSDPEYRASFEKRIRRFDRAGMEYLHSLELARRQWAPRAFDAGLPAVRALARWAGRLRAAGVPVVFVLAPENPLARELYANSRWYTEFGEFIAGLAGGPGDGAFDARALLPARAFYDHHHLTYRGAEAFTDWLAERLR